MLRRALTSTSWGCGLKQIPEEDQEVNPLLGNRGSDLLVAAQWSAEEAIHLEAELALPAMRPGGAGHVPLVEPEACPG